MNYLIREVAATYRGLELKMKVQVGGVGKGKGMTAGQGQLPSIKNSWTVFNNLAEGHPFKNFPFHTPNYNANEFPVFCFFFARISPKMVTYSIPVSSVFFMTFYSEFVAIIKKKNRMVDLIKRNLSSASFCF